MLNVDPQHWGPGVAQALITRAVTELSRRWSAPHAALRVLDQNARGRRFYEKEGWRLDEETRTELVGGKSLVEVRYVLELPTPRTGKLM